MKINKDRPKRVAFTVDDYHFLADVFMAHHVFGDLIRSDPYGDYGEDIYDLMNDWDLQAMRKYGLWNRHTSTNVVVPAL